MLACPATWKTASKCSSANTLVDQLRGRRRHPRRTPPSAGTRSRTPVARLSSTVTAKPSASSRSARCDPMKPAPPVTRTRLIDGRTHQLAEDLVERDRHVPARIVVSQPAEVADVTDVIATSRLVDVLDVERHAGELLEPLDRLEDRDGVAAAAAEVVDGARPRASRRTRVPPRTRRTRGGCPGPAFPCSRRCGTCGPRARSVRGTRGTRAARRSRDSSPVRQPPRKQTVGIPKYRPYSWTRRSAAALDAPNRLWVVASIRQVSSIPSRCAGSA